MTKAGATGAKEKTKRKPKGAKALTGRLNPRHEAFAQEMALSGGGHGAPSTAYRKVYDAAGQKADQKVAEGASRLMALAKIRARIEELRKIVVTRAERRFEITADKILQRLGAIGFSSLEDVVVVDVDGHARIDLGRADAVALRGFAGIKVKRLERVEDDEDDDDGAAAVPGDAGATAQTKPRRRVIATQVEIKLPDRTAALTKLGQHLNIFEHDGPRIEVNIGDVLERAMARAKDKAAARTTASKAV